VPRLPIKNLHAVAYSPLDWVDSETHWTSLRSIRDGAAGRKILLGVDPVTLAARASELDAGPGDTATGSAGDLIAFLSAHADNLFLREHVYDQLAAHGRLAVLHEVATAMAGRTDPPALADDRARLAAAVALEQDGDDYQRAVEDLKAAIARHGSTTSTFHLLLGQVYERGDEPRAKDLARACYSHVARTSDDEELTSAARAGLERLGD
jgi:hypothetical protein